MSAKDPHIISIDHLVLNPEQGLLLGNGDLSVSIYQKNDLLIWRFGKSDIWDRRYPWELNPAPLHIDELQHGLEVEGWASRELGGGRQGGFEARNGTDNEARMLEAMKGPQSRLRPFPNPKPVGELSFRLPSDLHGLQISQKLFIEEARVEIICRWRNAGTLTLNCFVVPDENIFALDWSLEGVDMQGTMLSGGNIFFPEFDNWFFDLYRWQDPDYRTFADDNGVEQDFPIHTDIDGATTLPAPAVDLVEGQLFIEQKFPAEKTFPDGFSYRLTPFVDGQCNIRHYEFLKKEQAQLRLLPQGQATSGRVCVHVATSLDQGGTEESQIEVISRYADFDEDKFAILKKKNKDAAQEFWSRSSVSLGEPLLERTWYEMLHLQRCIYGRGKVSPGLMLPSTVVDYTRWHGDYHTNYNFQSGFWGLCCANHPELMQSYFRACEFFFPVGRKIARDYFGCRGMYITLGAYPIDHEDDPFPVGQLSRMVYMTGWLWRGYWEYFQFTQDEKFLREECWPFLKDCALFFTDFMKKEDDGLYHVYPSNCDENVITGTPDCCRDRRENLLHAEFTLRTAINAAEILNCDHELVAEWQEKLSHWPAINPLDVREEKTPRLTNESNLNWPEFRNNRWLDSACDLPENLLFAPGHEFWVWYIGHAPMMYHAAIRDGIFKPQRDFENMCNLIERWREPGGIITAMSSMRYGRCGALTEILGFTGAVQELLLQSWRGYIELFPAWPKDRDASFNNLRTEQAFLISAELKSGSLCRLELTSLAGKKCCIKGLPPESKVCKSSDRSSVQISFGDDILSFDTDENEQYFVDCSLS